MECHVLLSTPLTRLHTQSALKVLDTTGDIENSNKDESLQEKYTVRMIEVQKLHLFS